MSMPRAASLRQERANWLRVQAEVAYVRVLFSGQSYFEALQREQRFNPNHDDRGRFTTGDGQSTGSSHSSDGARVAQAGPARPQSRTTILARFPAATPAQEVRWAISDAIARQEIAQTETVIPGYRPRPSVTSTIDGETSRNEADARDAREARARLQSDTLTGGGGAAPTAATKTLADVCVQNGRLIGENIKPAGPDVRSVTNEEFDQLLRDMTSGAQEVRSPPDYQGLWYRRGTGETVRVRRSKDYGLTVDIVDAQGNSALAKLRRIHEK